MKARETAPGSAPWAATAPVEATGASSISGTDTKDPLAATAPGEASGASSSAGAPTTAPASRAEKSQDERDSAKEAFNAKIEAFKKICKDRKITKPDLALLRDHFGAAELSALWDRLRQARKRSDMSISEAWTTIVSLPTGSTAAKRDVLFNFLVGEPMLRVT